jgi:hypothetical protein
MNIIKAPIESVIPWDKNPRGIKTKDYERLKKQILNLGVYKPLIAFEEKGKYVVLGGNMRIRALKDMGLKEVDISVVAPKTEAEKIEFALSDNDRVGAYDEQALAELIYPHIKDIDLGDFKVDLGDPWIDLQRVVERYGPNIDPEKEWTGMPECHQEDLTAFKSIPVHFKSAGDIASFAQLIGQSLTEKTRAIWHPKAEIDRYADKRYADEP